MANTKQRIDITIDKKLLKELDKERGLVARSAFIENLIRLAIKREDQLPDQFSAEKKKET